MPGSFQLGDMHDVTAPEAVQVVIRRDGKVVWVNVNGSCVFRACQIKFLEVDDMRQPTEDDDGKSIYPQSGD
jgi:hypothetical protein